MIKKIIIILLFIVPLGELVSAKETRITGRLLNNFQPVSGSIKMEVRADQMLLNVIKDVKTYTCNIGSNGVFEFIFDAPSDLTYVSFFVYDVLDKQATLSDNPFVGRIFFINKDSDISIDFETTNGKVRFSGKGSEILKCQYELSQLISPDLTNGFTFHLPLTERLSRESEMRNGYLAMHLRLLENFNNDFDSDVLNRIRIDLISKVKYQYLRSIFVSHHVSDQEKKAIWSQHFLNGLKDEKSMLFANDKLASSPWYIEYLFERERMIMLLDSSESDKSDMERMMNSITGNYTGLVRERVLLTFFFTLAKKNFKSLEPLLVRAEEQFKEGPNKIAFQKFVNENTAGKKVFPFSYVDEKGKVHKLEDYKDKIIVMDFWFNGCHGCLEIPAVLQPIIDRFKARKDVVFLSVNITKSKVSWMAGLKSGKYTCDGQIHLNVGNKSSGDDFLKTYNIRVFPRLFIIGKNGKLLASNPVDPRADGGRDIIEIINKNLK